MKCFNKGDVGKVMMISSQDRTRNNGFKLEKCRFNKKIGRNLFTNRVVDDWNRLNQQIVRAKTIGSFKKTRQLHGWGWEVVVANEGVLE